MDYTAQLDQLISLSEDIYYGLQYMVNLFYVFFIALGLVGMIGIIWWGIKKFI